MLKVFVQKSHSSCKKLLNWLERQDFDYEKRFIDKDPLSAEEILGLVTFTKNGFEDILSYRSLKILFNFTEKDIESFTVNELVALMAKHPALIKKPIALRGEQLFTGYDNTQVSELIPKEQRFYRRMKFYVMSETNVKR
ncbi:ArsC/Spx/MgsR family protein [Enterococcus sp. DIV0800]|uniref:ArsC/Spx/MgsR family protein n=1 Tax=unclassified Enterococcus TaxID=2608891 RepID=UPI003D2FBD81